ncbi:MAG: twin-arginine translocase TatA/TatE family subunit [Rickettsiaceae bacterium]|nr:twin-arginine translocase TatA/TatE family subunit [Rickettsiaceae bacterium]
MGLSLGHLIVILAIILLLFGAGRVPQIMGDLARGLNIFKKTLKEDSQNNKSQIDE